MIYFNNIEYFFFYIKNGCLYIKGTGGTGPARLRSMHLSNNNKSIFKNLVENTCSYKKSIFKNLVENTRSYVESSVIVKRFLKILILWAKRNGLIIPKNMRKFPAQLKLLVLCYPGLVNVIDAFPSILNGLKDENQQKQYFIHSSLTPHLRKIRGLDDLLDLICGNHGPRIKHLLMECSFAELFQALFLCRTLKGLCGFDKTFNIIQRAMRVRFYNSNGSFALNLGSYFTRDELRSFLRYYHKDTIYKWLCENYLVESGFTLFMDTVRMFRVYGSLVDLPRHETNLQHIHDYLRRESRKIQSRPLSFEKIVKKYQHVEQSFDQFRIEIPKGCEDLRIYSDKMCNCIHSYANRMDHEYCLLLGIYKDNQLTYNISIANNVLTEFLGKRNIPPNPQDKKVVIEKLIELKLIKPIIIHRDDNGQIITHQHPILHQTIIIYLNLHE